MVAKWEKELNARPISCPDCKNCDLEIFHNGNGNPCMRGIDKNIFSIRECFERREKCTCPNDVSCANRIIVYGYTYCTTVPCVSFS